ncbi:hypothetical protein GW17_00061139 [Ensete ventricosum]|nr:hypothetical protein GW17_00061139 [Ensete ventricosum]
MKLQPDYGPRYSLGIGPSSDDVVGSRWKFARRFVEGIGKLTGNAKGDRREEDRRTYRKIVGVCRKGTTFVKIPVDKPPVSGYWTAHTIESGLRPAGVDG